MTDTPPRTPLDRNTALNFARSLSFNERLDLILRILFTAAVAVGCYYIVEPFLTAILIAAILAVVTWPLFARIRNSLGHAATPAAFLMITAIIVVLLIPLSVLLLVVAQQIPKAVTLIADWVRDPMPILQAVKDTPYVGEWLYEQVMTAIDPSTLGHTIEQIIQPATQVVLGTALNVSNGLVQLALVTFIVFFFYRDGAWFSDRIATMLERVSGGIQSEILDILTNTTRSVVLGIVGTALCQGVVAGIGFWIAGVPGVLLLSSAVCIVSVVPIGPPLVWIPVAIWLYTKGEVGMALFLCAWGSIVVALVDNLVRPLLIARGSTLPMGLVFLGVFGGVISFGFLGLILGPLLLAIGMAMFQAWLKYPVHRAEALAATEASEASESGAAEASTETNETAASDTSSTRS